MKSTSLCK